MRRILTKSRRRHEADVSEAKVRMSEICKIIGLPRSWAPDDDELVLALKAADEVKRHDAACAVCQYTVEDCDKCQYNSDAFKASRYDNHFLGCITACKKYSVQVEQKRIAKLLGNSGMGARFRTRTFSTFCEDDMNKQAKQHAETFCAELRQNPQTRGLMLIGTCGCGKTHLAAAIVHQSAADGIPSMFIVVPELLAQIRASYGSDNIQTAEPIIYATKNIPLLILDDLGAEKESEWAREQLYLIINYRYEHTLPIIVTTNSSGTELEQKLGQRIVSRLAEMTMPVGIKAADYRIKLAKEMVIDR